MFKMNLNGILRLVIALFLIIAVIIYFPLKSAQNAKNRFCHADSENKLSIDYMLKKKSIYYQYVNDKCCEYALINRNIKIICN